MTTEESPRPRSLMLTFLGDQVLGRGVRVSSGSVIDVFTRAGVGEQATRSTLTRMVSRGLLRRQRAGRRMHFGLTGRSAAVPADGERRVWHTGAVNRHWDGTWTLLGFSLPESWQRQRHDLRSQLTWSGFGPLFNGLWIAPGEADVSAPVAELGLSAHVKVFRARADAGMEIGAMIEESWELSELAARYRAFARRWQPWESELPAVDDALSLRLVMQAEWLGVICRDPRLPFVHLPDDWPAERAEKTFRAMHERLAPLAREASERLLDLVPVREDQPERRDQA
ncbi:PaaX family transcriptional regulator [Streptomyces sp. NBC_01451]|uniref:PaaX family transcriptional regulator n=1 Tax=Streptomyces sp. NBC_01451 TaxID=2903872 RepID=UPI002E34AFD5|nr:PaaX family transcriptional regulator C-terminal domain-containing protein [Streptomyces sp. NBC_01451]